MLIRIDQRRVADICDKLGIRRADGSHLDAGETAFLARQLEYVEAAVYETKYPALLALKFIPLKTDIPNSVESWSYNMWDSFGMAHIIHSYADDLPMVGRFAERVVARIRSIGDAFGYSLQDLRNALFAGVSLESDLAMVARRAIDTKIDELLAVGSADDGLAGFLNNANITDVTLPTGTWASATALQILADLHFLANSIRVASKQLYVADTMLYDQASWDIITTKPMADNNTETVLSTFLKQSSSVRNVDVWWRLDTAASGSPAILAYARTPEVVEAVVPQLFEMLPPQPKNLSFIVPCHARCGGCSLKYPIGAAKTDDQ